MPLGNVLGSIRNAYHLLAGNLNNYYHWMVDVIARFDSGLNQRGQSGIGSNRPIVLVPGDTPEFARQCLDIVCSSDVPILELATESAIFVEELEFFGFSNYPMPQQFGVFQRIRSEFFNTVDFRLRRLYISRTDTKQRRLLNEDEVIYRVEKAGFECCSLSDKSLSDQIELFSQATHIVAPHGAGLTNIVFCNPGTKVCELQMNNYLNWVFRYIAGCGFLRYGCILGPMDEPREAWIHNNTWTLPMNLLEELLTDSRFIS